jgi:hypothetical protein
VTPHQRLDLGALRFFLVVLDCQGANLVPVERESLERFQLRSLDIKADKMNEGRGFRPFEDVAKRDGGQLD